MRSPEFNRTPQSHPFGSQATVIVRSLRKKRDPTTALCFAPRHYYRFALLGDVRRQAQPASATGVPADTAEAAPVQN
ncbi:hypothetical protein ETAA8_10310 [Anatilimnocola aggregata]|uniref:Uncharacterized protein n=1 Tax=Anatilimnocola aggregata TaxID=2528021 RepID=A0A517Y6U7_9BACT|nr:hypothetical protein ETAA8_10310 [Anatilimnocola aggregata]